MLYRLQRAAAITVITSKKFNVAQPVDTTVRFLFTNTSNTFCVHAVEKLATVRNYEDDVKRQRQ